MPGPLFTANRISGFWMLSVRGACSTCRELAACQRARG